MQCKWLSRWQLQDLMFSQLCYRGFKFLECDTLSDSSGLPTHEGEGITVFCNAASHSANNTVSHPRRCEALGYIYWTVEGIPILWFIAMKQNLFLMCMHTLLETCGRHAQLTWDTWAPCTSYLWHVGTIHSLPETRGRHPQLTRDMWAPCTAYLRHVGAMHILPVTCGHHAQLTWDTWATCTAYLRHVGAPSRLIVQHPLNWHSLNFFGLTQDWQTFLRACAPIVDNFWRNSFAFRKPKVTSTIFPIIPVTS